jgi:hypothetical protein
MILKRDQGNWGQQGEIKGQVNYVHGDELGTGQLCSLKNAYTTASVGPSEQLFPPYWPDAIVPCELHQQRY